MTRILCILLLVPYLHAGPPLDPSEALAIVRRIEQQRIDLAAKLAPTVCAVFRGQGGGSGVIITDDGLVLSNFHVTGLEAQMRIGLNDQRIHPAVVLGVDPSGDLSLLRLTEKRRWAFARLGDSDALRQGDWVYAMGNPFLLATDFTPTITLGVVSGINRYQPGSLRGQLLYPDCIQTDASINPGNSGGPLFNFRGEVVGINGRVSLRERGRVNIGVGYAISSNQIKHCLPELRAGKIVEHGTLNATVRDIEDPAWPGRVRITFDQLMMPGAGHDAGIRVGDALLSFQGRRVGETNEFLRLISILPKGRRVSLRVASFNDDKWVPRDLRATLDGIQLVKKSAKAQRKPPRTYLEQEVVRTFAAARAVLHPIGAETRKGTLQVTGREPRPIEEVYRTDRSVTIRIGDRVRTATATGGSEGLDPDKRLDMLERVAAINDLTHADGIRHFKSFDFTGGALVAGVTVDRIEVEAKNGDKRVYFIHLDTGRLMRVDLYARTWVRWVSLYFDSWQNAKGLRRATRVMIWDRDKEKLLQTLTYASIRSDT